MPPPVSDIDESDTSMIDEIPAKKTSKAPPAEEDEEDESSEEEEDEYNVEKILDHKTHKGQVLYRIKWLGYDDPTDETWEPIENLSGAPEILKAYHIQVNGTPQPPSGSSKKKVGSAIKGKGKRAASDESPAPTAKKGRKSAGATNGNLSSPAWTPPEGLWETEITEISAIIEDEPEIGTVKRSKDTKNLEGLVLWGNGKKTQHKMKVLRTKCPQKLLDYYESHLVFRGDPRFVE